MRTEKQRLGAWGENIATQHYQRLGFRIVARNFRCKFGELDLLCSKESELYSIEVKTRRSLHFGFPEEAVDARKKERLMRATSAFLAAKKQSYRMVCIQVCSVIVTKEKVILKIYTIC